MKINLAYLKEHAPSVVTPVIITNQGDKTLTFDDVDSVDPGKRIMTLNKNKPGTTYVSQGFMCWSR